MAKRQPKSCLWYLSRDAADKLQACPNQTWAESDYLAAKDYYDACIAGFQRLENLANTLPSG